MYRFLLFLFITFSLEASFIKKVEVLEVQDKSLKIDDIRNSTDFKRIKLPFIRHSKIDYFIKLTLNKKEIEDGFLEISSEFNFIEFDNRVYFIDIFENVILDINKKKDIPEVLFFKIKNSDGYLNFNVKKYEKAEYVRGQLIKTKLYGVAYGILFTAFLYYLALFLFNKEKSHIYYALTQLFMLAVLLIISYANEEKDKNLIDIAFFFFFLFSNLFTKNFLNTKKYTPRLDKILTGLIFIYLIEMLTNQIFGIGIIKEYIPMSSLLVFYLFAGYIVYQKGYKPALFYLLGWGIMVLSFLFVEAQFYFTNEPLLLHPIYIIHIASPLESLILAFALSYKMKMIEDKRHEQQQYLIHQSKLASMGEMIGNIAHQWRQPLTHLSYILMNIKTAYKKDKLSQEYFNKKTNEANEQLEYMSHTINDFRDFFKVDKKKESFSLNKCIYEVINLLQASFKSNEIEVKYIDNKEYEITTLKGEFMQVLFNLLNNAKDEFAKKEISKPKINIILEENENTIFIKIEDNAFGIKEELLEKIFEPYFTTKESGLGLGLYMSKMIIEKNINGVLKVKNIKDGACFTIELQKVLV